MRDRRRWGFYRYLCLNTPYRDWLKAHRGHRLFAFSTGVSPVRADSVTGVVIDRDGPSYFPIRGRNCLVSPDGQVLTTYVAHEIPDAEGEGGEEEFGGVSNINSAFEMLSRLPQSAVVRGGRAGRHNLGLASRRPDDPTPGRVEARHPMEQRLRPPGGIFPRWQAPLSFGGTEDCPGGLAD